MNFSEIRSGFFIRTAGVALLYFAAAKVGLMYAVVGSTVTLAWPPSGIALVAILVFGYRMIPGIALGAFLANAGAELALPLAAGIAIGNTLEALAGAFMLKHLARFRNTLSRRRDVFALILLAGICSTTIGAFFGALTLAVGGMVSLGEYAPVWLKWWLGDMMGVLVVAPPLLVWFSYVRPVLSLLKIIEAASLLVILLVVSYKIFASPALASHGYYPASLAVFPFVIWGALRFDHWGATLVTGVISVLAIWGTTQGVGPFAVGSPVDSLVGWCIFVNVLAVSGLLLAAFSAAQRRDQAALKAAHDELALKKAEAERANQAKSSFIAAASHDLRQPMHAVALYVAALQPDMAGSAAAITLGKIEAAVAAMENMFSAIMDVSKLDAGVVVPEVACMPVKELLAGLCDEFCNEAGAKGLRLRIRHRTDSVASDPVLLGRILRNLISNALRYTDHGGVLIAARRFEGAIRFQVWDTGRGIAPEHMAQVFHEHFQVTDSPSNRPQGQGLGLAIVDRLARLLEHPLSVHSRPGMGTVFSLDVPVCQHDPVRLGSGNEALAGIARLHGLVAIVDDDAMVLERAPDLLITDYHLAAENGLDLVKNVRNAYPDEALKVIVMTGDTTEKGMSILNECAYPVLYKPVRPARLRALITHLLRLTGTNSRGDDT